MSDVMFGCTLETIIAKGVSLPAEATFGALEVFHQAQILRAEVIRLRALLAAQQASKPGSAVFWLGVEGESAISGRNTPQTASEAPYAPQTGSDAPCEPGGNQDPLETGARP